MARLLADGRFAFRLWVAYPHQNGAELASAVGESREYLAAVARLAGLSGGWLPGFGPFPIPPARELVAAYRPDGGVVVVAQIYPTMALIGRLAGLVAGNPWLAGGEVRLPSAVGTVRWRGSSWILESEGAALSAAKEVPKSAEVGPALAVVGVTEKSGPWQAGLYVATRARDRTLEIRPAGGRQAPWGALRDVPLLGGETFLVAVNGHGGPFGEAVGALAFQRALAVEAGQLPSAAVLFPPDTPSSGRFRLPGESLARRLGAEMYEARVGQWSVLALDRRALAAAERLGPRLDTLLAPSNRATGESKAPFFGLWLKPAALSEYATVLLRTYRRVPLIPRREIHRWQDVQRVFSPLAALGRIVVVAGSGGVWFRFEQSQS